jgi:hypothetical protein
LPSDSQEIEDTFATPTEIKLKIDQLSSIPRSTDFTGSAAYYQSPNTMDMDLSSDLEAVEIEEQIEEVKMI